MYLFAVFAFLLIIALLIAKFRRNRHSMLYQEGIRLENSGEYLQAIENFLRAKIELEKVKNRQKQIRDIDNRIKTLHTMINYESNFHNEHHGIA